MTPEFAVIVAIAAPFVTTGVSYGVLRAQVTANAAAIEKLDREKASKEVLEQMQRHIDSRFDELRSLILSSRAP